MYNGMVNIYKEAGYTSHDVVAKLRGILRQKKIGHTGTLDPAAVGVLPVCLGSATKLCDMFTDKGKEYRAQFQLGISTDTQDTTGEIVSTRTPAAGKEQILNTIMSFRGSYDQIPPMYSALKVDGKRLYELAREGKEIERKARTVHLYQIVVEKIEPPFVTMSVSCSKGTYIRTLCHDIGERLGCGAAMSKLERTRVGDFTADDAFTLADMERLVQDGKVEDVLLTVEDALRSRRRICVSEESNRMLVNGNPIAEYMIDGKNQFKELEQIRMCDSNGKFYGLYEYRMSERKFWPVKMFME